MQKDMAGFSHLSDERQVTMDYLASWLQLMIIQTVQDIPVQGYVVLTGLPYTYQDNVTEVFTTVRAKSLRQCHVCQI